jgi:hypothetical protein
MAWAKNLMGSGHSGGQALANVGRFDSGVTATGSSSQANSYLIRAENTVVSTTAANTGVRLPDNLSAGDSGIIANNGGSTLFIYPPVGGIINGNSADAKIDCATLKGARYTCLDKLNFNIVVG